MQATWLLSCLARAGAATRELGLFVPWDSLSDVEERVNALRAETGQWANNHRHVAVSNKVPEPGEQRHD
jgi:hypothetical protein